MTILGILGGSELLSDLIANMGTCNQQNQNASIRYKDTNDKRSAPIPCGCCDAARGYFGLSGLGIHGQLTTMWNKQPWTVVMLIALLFEWIPFHSSPL